MIGIVCAFFHTEGKGFYSKFDGMTVSGSSDLVGKLEYYQAGETVEVVISRAQNGEYQEQTVSVTLGKKSEMKQADPQQGK